MFQQLDRLVSDAILGLMAQFRADPFKHKVDLGVGVYRDLSGNTPILECVRRAERERVGRPDDQGLRGAARPRGIQRGIGGIGAWRRPSDAVESGAPALLQMPGGLRRLARRRGTHQGGRAQGRRPCERSDLGESLPPCWEAAGSNSSAILTTRRKRTNCSSRPCCDRLQTASEGDVVLMHACCHNPTGADSRCRTVAGARPSCCCAGS